MVQFFIKTESKKDFFMNILKSLKEKSILFLILIFSFNVYAEETFLVQLNKCVLIELDMLKSSDLKILTNASLSLVCSKGLLNKTNCKIMEKNGDTSELIGQRDFVLSMSLGDTTEFRGDQDPTNLLILNQKQKKSFFYSREMKSQTLIQNTNCSGTYKDSNDLKKIFAPKKEEKKISKPQEITPAMIGE